MMNEMEHINRRACKKNKKQTYFDHSQNATNHCTCRGLTGGGGRMDGTHAAGAELRG